MPFSDSIDDSGIERVNPIQNITFGDKPQKKLLLQWGGKRGYCERKIAIKKVTFSENLSKLFSKADEIFDNQRINDDLSEITTPNTQKIFKELNDRKIPENFFREEKMSIFQTIYRQILPAKFNQKIK